MRPAFSVIFLTTLIGAGQGLFLALFTAESYAAFDLLPAIPPRFLAIGSLIAVILLIAGLGASFFHLGHPERAWRSASQWRTSWLSREVIVLPAFIGATAVYGLAHASGFNPVFGRLPSGLAINLTAILGVLGTLLAFALFVCTAMIYASLRFLREWHTPLTVINFILLGGASGFSLAAALAALLAADLAVFFAGWALILTFAASLGRTASLRCHTRRHTGSTLQTAIGIKHPRIVQIAQGAMGGSFNTREFFHGQPQRLVDTLVPVFVASVFALPLILLAYSLGTGGALKWPLMLAAFLQCGGMIAERWTFFAHASHPQNLYYRAVA